MTSLKELAERLERATRPDREIDAMLEAWVYTLENDAQADIVCDSDQVERGHYWVRIDGGRTLYCSAPLTASLDAAIALCERVLPGWGWSVTRKDAYTWSCVTKPTVAVEIVRGEVDARFPALGFCLAIVRAKLAEEAQ